jgi:hypothetical protein
MTTAKLVSIDIVVLSRGSNPYAMASHTRLEALHTDNGEEKPEEANQKRHIDQQGCSLFQTSQNDLALMLAWTLFFRHKKSYRSSTCEIQETDDAQATEHLENKDSLGFLDIKNTQYEGNPE